MENKINILFYSNDTNEISGYAEELKKLGYCLNYKTINDIGDVKQEISDSEWDIFIIDDKTAANNCLAIINKVRDWKSDLGIILVSENVNKELIKLLHKDGINEIVNKFDTDQICLSIIRNFEKSKMLVQFEFTKKELLRIQKTQIEHDNFLNQIIESTSNPIFYKGTEGRYLGCNKAFAEFIGRPKEDIIGKTVFDISPKELANKYHEMDQEFFKDPVTQRYEYKVANVKGELMDVVFYKTAIRDDQKNVVGLLGHMFDITDRKQLETEIKEEKELAQNILDTSNEMYISLDLQGNISSVNKKTCEVFETNKDLLIGKNWFNDIISKDELEDSKRVFHGIIDNKADLKETLVRKIVTAKQEEKNISWRNRQIKNSEGKVIGILSSGREVVNQSELEHKLEISERKYQLLVENMYEGLSIVDFNETVMFSNQSFDKIFGCEPGEMTGRNLKEFILEEDLNKVSLETNQRKSKKSSQYRVRIKRKDGKYRTLNLSSVPWKNKNDEVVGTIAMVMDVTAEEFAKTRLEKKIQMDQSIVKISSQFISMSHFEDKLKNALKELKNIIEAERYSVLSIRNNKLNLISEQHDNESTIHGIEFEQIDYSSFKYSLNVLDNLDFIFIDDVSALPEEAKTEREIFEKHKIFNFLGIPFYSGTKLEGLVVISNIYESDEWTLEDLSLLRTVSDIIGHAFNRRKAEEKAEKLKQDLITKNNELEQVVYVTSHDIRSPVVNILGFSDEMIKALNKLSERIFHDSNSINNKEDIEFLLEKDIPHILNFIKVSGQKIDKLLLALLQLSRLGRASINKVNVNMNDMMKSLLSTFEFKIKEHNIQVEQGELPECFTDEVQINQVFSNLIDNAIKYRSPERDTIIKITAKQDENSVTYCIEDNGIGISETELDKIFDVFYRINPENQEGEGMGLSLIKKTIDRLNGKISVGSIEGEGTKFYINLEKQKL